MSKTTPRPAVGQRLCMIEWDRGTPRIISGTVLTVAPSRYVIRLSNGQTEKVRPAMAWRDNWRAAIEAAIVAEVRTSRFPIANAFGIAYRIHQLWGLYRKLLDRCGGHAEP